MIHVNMNLGTSAQHGTKFLKSLNDGEQFLFTCGEIALCWIWLVRKMCHRTFVLKNGSTKLHIRGIHANVERFIVVGVC